MLYVIIKTLFYFIFFKQNFKLVFTFSKNDYFTNEKLEKVYTVNSEHIIESITSTEINWTKRDIAFELKDVKMKNKSK